MKVFSVTGLTGSGKTSTIEGIISELVARGFSVGTVKDIHFDAFEIDTEGKNTWRHRHAGAGTVTALSKKETDVMYQGKMPIYQLLAHYTEDFVILEGNNDAVVPNIAVSREDAEPRISPLTIAVSGCYANNHFGEFHVNGQSSFAGQNQSSGARGEPNILSSNCARGERNTLVANCANEQQKSQSTSCEKEEIDSLHASCENENPNTLGAIGLDEISGKSSLMCGAESSYTIPIINGMQDKKKLVDLIVEKTPELMQDIQPECCGLCGHDCRGLLARMLRGEESLKKCVLNTGSVCVSIDGEKMVLVPFVEKLVKNAVLGVVKELKGYKKGKNIVVEFFDN